MHDRVQPAQRGCVGEDDARDPLAVKAAVRAQHLGPELRHHLGQAGRARGDDVMGRGVGVDDVRTAAREQTRETSLLPEPMPPVRPTRSTRAVCQPTYDARVPGRNQYSTWFGGEHADWDISGDGPIPFIDLRYFGNVFRLVDRLLPDAGLHVLATDALTGPLPVSGREVIVLCLNDEFGRCPAYCYDVGLVVKTMGGGRRSAVRRDLAGAPLAGRLAGRTPRGCRAAAPAAVPGAGRGRDVAARSSATGGRRTAGHPGVLPPRAGAVRRAGVRRDVRRQPGQPAR